MFVLLLLVVLAVVAAVMAYGAHSRARSHPPTAPTPDGATPLPPSATSTSRLTEAVAYVGGILVVAGAGAAVGQRWDQITPWGHVGVLGAAAALFLAAGLVLRGSRDAALRRVVDVAWSVSVVALGATAGVLAAEVYDVREEAVTLLAGLTGTAYAAGLWWARKHALEVVATFLGSVVTVVGVVVLPGEPAALQLSLALWVLGGVWVGLAAAGWVQPVWVAAPLGVVLALVAPSIAVGPDGWVYAIGIGTAALAMGLSIPRRDTPLLALGTVAMFGYVTSAVVRYFGDSLGVPATLAVTGVLILVLAAVGSRLARRTRSGPEARRTHHWPTHHGIKAA